jgi:hypothetical protein
MTLYNMPSTVVVLRGGTDEYGTPGAGWDSPTVVATAKGFLAKSDLLLIAAGTPIQAGDRVTVDGVPYELTEDPYRARSFFREKVVVAKVRAVDT